MNGERFDTRTRSLSRSASRRSVLGAMAGIGAVGAGMAVVGTASAARAEKVTICHRTGNGGWNAITVSKNAQKAHLNHGDYLPGDEVPDGDGATFGDDCSIVEAPDEGPTPTRYSSPELSFGPNGWGGWSCPAGTEAVGGGYLPDDATVQQSHIAKPGEVYPHYTFGPNESGWVVQNDNDQETITVYVDCVTTT